MDFPMDWAGLEVPIATRDWTDGCIAVTNEEMDEIWRAAPDGIPIEIRP